VNALWFMGLTFGILLGYLLKSLVNVILDLRDAREVRIAEQLAPKRAPRPRYTAKQILGYSDGGSRRVPPTHPLSAAAASSAAALAAWERGRQ
jgi:hypothetical protein